MGTKNLRVKLASLQMHIIRSSFKGITRDLKQQHEETLKEYVLLGEIPSSLTEKRALFRSTKEHIWSRIGAFVLSGRIDSLHDDSDMRPSAKFFDQSKRYQDKLNSSKLATVSDIKIGTKVTVPTWNIVSDEVCYIDETNDKVYITYGIEEVDVNISPSLLKHKPGNVIHHNSEVYIERDGGHIDELKAFDRKLVHPDPNWISALIQLNRPYELPIFINTDVFKAIVADLIDKEWTPPTMELLNFTTELMDNAVEKFIKQIKTTKSFPLLESYLVSKASEVVGSLKEQVKQKVQDFIKREKVPYTQNHYLFENVCKLRSQRLMDEVLSSVDGMLDDGESRPRVTLNPSRLMSSIRNTFERNQKRSVEDHMVEEMQNALNSYGKVALKRFIDNVPMLCIEIMQKFADEMNNVLSELTDEELNRIVIAPSGVIDRRNKLKRKSDALEQGILALCDLY